MTPADIYARECSVGKLKDCLLWWNEPEFLLGGKEMWPSQELLLQKNVDLEEKGSREVVSSVNVNFSGSEVGIEKVIDCGRFTLLNKFVRVTAFVLRYVHNLKPFLKGCEVTKEDLLLEEIEKSKLVWVKYEQYFIKNSENYTNLKNSLNLFIDSEDVIRCRSRISEANQLTFKGYLRQQAQHALYDQKSCIVNKKAIPNYYLCSGTEFLQNQTICLPCCKLLVSTWLLKRIPPNLSIHQTFYGP